jgi:phosphatidate cytidylyltransferase
VKRPLSEKVRRYGFGALLLGGTGLVVWVDLHGPPFPLGPLVLAALAVLAIIEFHAMVAPGIPPSLRATALAVAAAVIVAAATGPASPLLQSGIALGALSFLAFPALGVVMVATRWRSSVRPGDLAAMAVSCLGVALIAWPLGLLTLLYREPEGPLLVLALVLVSKSNDIAGYVVGSRFGRHPLCPGISPRKSWEGSLAGLALCLVAALLVRHLVPAVAARLGPVAILGFSLSVGLATQFGDLLESLIKRASGVKDSGRAIPAFGGIFDLVDSFVLAAPAGYTWLALGGAP